MDAQTSNAMGSHLMLDCYGCSRDKLADRDFILRVLNSLPDKIKTTKVNSPQVFECRWGEEEERGISGIVKIASSHISIHTFPDKNHAFVDVFSSKMFDLDSTRAELLEMFGAHDHKIRVSGKGIGEAIPSTVYH
jgi:S-adenosylmethionine/arginine decarboxylase-like enzyme